MTTSEPFSLGDSSDALAGRTCRIVTGARLHFGLLDTVAPFGGVGMMITDPATVVAFDPAKRFLTAGPASERVQRIAVRFKNYFKDRHLPKCRVQVVGRPQPHSGLGTGTQLDLAIAEGFCRMVGRSIDREQLALRIAARGLRSAVGTHGYFQGGLVYEVGADNEKALNPIKDRFDFPQSWRLVLLSPNVQNQPTQKTVSGRAEQQHFDDLEPATESQRQQLLQLIEQELIPAVQLQQFERFSRAVYEYNRLSGSLFAAVQGGVYHGPEVTRLVDNIRALGVVGVGQSSWGPSVFAFFEDADSAREVAGKLDSTNFVTITSGKNGPRFAMP